MSRSAPILASLLILAPAAALAQSDGPASMRPMRGPAAPVVTLSVTETVDAAPDIATINSGVETRAPTAKEAMAANARQMDALITALLKAGVERRDIRTSSLNLNPQYDYSNRTEGQGPRFLGYQANNMLAVTIRRIDRAGEIVDAMVNAGATNVNGPAFGIDDPSGLEEQARAKAVKTAQARADFYAQAAGYKGARLLSISEGGQIERPMPVMRMAAPAQDSVSTKIEPGQLSTSITLNFRYMLER